jgi:anti-sigma factor RsiW
MRRLQTLLDHLYTRRRVSGYLDGDLSSDARARVERHARECDDCGKTLGALSRIGAALRRLGQPQRSPAPFSGLGQARRRSPSSR